MDLEKFVLLCRSLWSESIKGEAVACGKIYLLGFFS